MSDNQRQKGDVTLRTKSHKDNVRIQLETDGGALDFSLSAEGATNFGLQLIKAAYDAERSNG